MLTEGTLFDVYSIQALAEEIYSLQGSSIAVMWCDKQISTHDSLRNRIRMFQKVASTISPYDVSVCYE